jgi:hypothetical protein
MPAEGVKEPADETLGAVTLFVEDLVVGVLALSMVPWRDDGIAPGR